jgi:polysaccharide biosynthesis/export protein ExoF
VIGRANKLFEPASAASGFRAIGALRPILGAALAIVLTILASASAEAADYALGAMDKLHIRVAEWRTAEGAVRDWSSMSGDYTVGPAGNISLPFIGEMPAAGKTTAALATEIGDQLQQKFGLLDRPDASVELAEFRPFFISGDVQTPNRYPYAPGLTVLKAVSLAGGVRRSADLGQRFARDFINARGSYEVLVAQRNSLIAKRARLIAEADDKAEIEFPKELRESDAGRKLIADETAFRDARAHRLKDQLKAIDDLKKLLQSEIESLDKKIATQNRQIDLSREELASVGNLAEQGLVVKQRILTLERQTADLEGKVLDMETASLRAKQDISKATQDAVTLQSDRDTGIAQDRQDAEADIQQVDLKIAMYRDLMAEAMDRDPQAALTAGMAAGAAPTVSYTIVRDQDGKPTETPANEGTEVLPGDVVKVELVVGPVD